MNSKIQWFLSRKFCIVLSVFTEIILKKNKQVWLFGLNTALYKKGFSNFKSLLHIGDNFIANEYSWNRAVQELSKTLEEVVG